MIYFQRSEPVNIVYNLKALVEVTLRVDCQQKWNPEDMGFFDPDWEGTRTVVSQSIIRFGASKKYTAPWRGLESSSWPYPAFPRCHPQLFNRVIERVKSLLQCDGPLGKWEKIYMGRFKYPSQQFSKHAVFACKYSPPTWIHKVHASNGSSPSLSHYFYSITYHFVATSLPTPPGIPAPLTTPPFIISSPSTTSYLTTDHNPNPPLLTKIPNIEPLTTENIPNYGRCFRKSGGAPIPHLTILEPGNSKDIAQCNWVYLLRKTTRPFTSPDTSSLIIHFLALPPLLHALSHRDFCLFRISSCNVQWTV